MATDEAVTFLQDTKAALHQPWRLCIPSQGQSSPSEMPTEAYSADLGSERRGAEPSPSSSLPHRLPAPRLPPSPTALLLLLRSRAYLLHWSKQGTSSQAKEAHLNGRRGALLQQLPSTAAFPRPSETRAALPSSELSPTAVPPRGTHCWGRRTACSSTG